MARRVRVLYTCLTLCLFAPLTGAAQTAARATPMCPQCVECPGETDTVRIVRLKLYNQSHLTDANLNALVTLSSRIWLPYGVTIELGTRPDAVAVVVFSGQRRFGFDNKPSVLGETLFTQKHATPYIRLWLGAAEDIADATRMGIVPFRSMSRVQRDDVLVQMMGVALAHELAHYLLDTERHSARGLLQASMNVRDMQQPDLARLELTPSQQRLMCGPVAR